MVAREESVRCYAWKVVDVREVINSATGEVGWNART